MTTWPRSWSIWTTRICRAKSDPEKRSRRGFIFPLRDGRVFPIFPLHAATDRRRHPGFQGAIAQLGERYNGIVEVSGSIPLGSTNKSKGFVGNGEALVIRVYADCTQAGSKPGQIRKSRSPCGNMRFPLLRALSGLGGRIDAIDYHLLPPPAPRCSQRQWHPTPPPPSLHPVAPPQEPVAARYNSPKPPSAN